MTPDELREGWTPHRIGLRIIVLPEVASTNRAALDMAADEGADGLAVLADYQSNGRGRLGRAWNSPRGASVLLSVLLLSDDSDEALRDDNGAIPSQASGDARVQQDVGAELAGSSIGGRLTLVAAVASCQAIRRTTTVTPVIKWPNDLLVANRKLGGILTESSSLPNGLRAWVVGIGINCLQHAGHFSPELGETATSLELEASHPIDRTAVARELLRALNEWLSHSVWLDHDALRTAWQMYAQPIGQRIRVRCNGQEYTGRTLAIEPHGGLIVQCDNGGQKWFDPMTTTLL